MGANILIELKSFQNLKDKERIIYKEDFSEWIVLKF